MLVFFRITTRDPSLSAPCLVPLQSKRDYRYAVILINTRIRQRCDNLFIDRLWHPRPKRRESFIFTAQKLLNFDKHNFFKREQDKVGDKKKGKEEKSIERPKNPEGAYIDASFY